MSAERRPDAVQERAEQMAWRTGFADGERQGARSAKFEASRRSSDTAFLLMAAAYLLLAGAILLKLLDKHGLLAGLLRAPA